MNKCIITLMAFLILATSWPANQGCFAIVKMGVFIQHFVHHLVCGQEEIGILDFVGLHYFNHEHHHFNPADYDNLPVQHHQPEQQSNVQYTPFWLIVLQQVGASPNMEIVSVPLFAHQQHWVSALYTGNIWKPPKA